MLGCKIKEKQQRVLDSSIRPQLLVLSLSGANCEFWQATSPLCVCHGLSLRLWLSAIWCAELKALWGKCDEVMHREAFRKGPDTCEVLLLEERRGAMQYEGWRRSFQLWLALQIRLVQTNDGNEARRGPVLSSVSRNEEIGKREARGVAS